MIKFGESNEFQMWNTGIVWKVAIASYEQILPLDASKDRN